MYSLSRLSSSGDGRPSLALCRVIQNVIDHVPKVHYLVAVDDSVQTLEDLIKVQPSSPRLMAFPKPFRL